MATERFFTESGTSPPAPRVPAATYKEAACLLSHLESFEAVESFDHLIDPSLVFRLKVQLQRAVSKQERA